MGFTAFQHLTRARLLLPRWCLHPSKLSPPEQPCLSSPSGLYPLAVTGCLPARPRGLAPLVSPLRPATVASLVRPWLPWASLLKHHARCLFSVRLAATRLPVRAEARLPERLAKAIRTKRPTTR